MPASVNIARRLTHVAQNTPYQRAIVRPVGRDSWGRVSYSQLTFEQLDGLSDRLAAAMRDRRLRPGMKLVLFVPFSIEFIALTFALFKAGVVCVLIDPGMGRKNIFACLERVRPDGFVAIPLVQWVRWWTQKKFSSATLNISVGRRCPGVAATYRELLQGSPTPFQAATTRATDPAAIIFTSGSTGPPKGVLYEHGMFDAQVDLIQQFYGIEPGEIDLPGFPLFGLFNAAMGVTTVIPDMDPTKPAQVDPEKIIEAIRDQGVTQAFGSPAFWNQVGRYCEQHSVQLPSLKRALSAGGPVPTHVLERMGKVLTPPADLHTPYGATESLPIASISGREVLETTAERTRQGQGTCVGRRFPSVHVRIIRPVDGPIESIHLAEELKPNEVGEIIVKSPSVTKEYFDSPEGTRLSKIPDEDRCWHRIGDMGYLDDEGLLWFCGRKAHIVDTACGPHYSVCCEAIFNNHPRVYRSALVGLGSKPEQTPGIVIEPEQGEFPSGKADEAQFREQLLELARANDITREIQEVFFHPSLPVDTRHNVKINREALAKWAAQRRT